MTDPVSPQTRDELRERLARTIADAAKEWEAEFRVRPVKDTYAERAADRVLADVGLRQTLTPAEDRDEIRRDAQQVLAELLDVRHGTTDTWAYVILDAMEKAGFQVSRVSERIPGSPPGMRATRLNAIAFELYELQKRPRQAIFHPAFVAQLREWAGVLAAHETEETQ